MTSRLFFFVLSTCLLFISLFVYDAPSWNEASYVFPVLYKGRYRPVAAYAHLWLEELSSESITSHTLSGALAALWAAEREQANELIEEPTFRMRLNLLKQKGLPPAEVAHQLEKEFSLAPHATNDTALFFALPSQMNGKEVWLPLRTLLLERYHPSSDRLELIENFTTFPDERFFAIQHAYRTWLTGDTLSFSAQEALQKLALELYDGYRSLAGTPFQRAHLKQLNYPHLWQLSAEVFYLRHSWTFYLILSYLFAGCLWLMAIRGWISRHWALGCTIVTYFGHTLLLCLRSAILHRPPVSNMLETILYVPWVSTSLFLFLPSLRRYPLAGVMTSWTSALLLAFCCTSPHLDQVQAVLDSHFWLVVHVLLVVGSYALFLLAALLGHCDLIAHLFRREKTPLLRPVPALLLQMLYGGTFMLITGTILGGIWAAESWGRFWDWDPKEAWAFISSGLYLLFIHAYQFGYVSRQGLAGGAILGFLSITFTWYGVNYLLKTGLHSYGIGSGGELYYFLWLALELFFLAVVFLRFARRNRCF